MIYTRVAWLSLFHCYVPREIWYGPLLITRRVLSGAFPIESTPHGQFILAYLLIAMIRLSVTPRSHLVTSIWIMTLICFNSPQTSWHPRTVLSGEPFGTNLGRPEHLPCGDNHGFFCGGLGYTRIPGFSPFSFFFPFSKISGISIKLNLSSYK